jgi:uncharacterized protein YjiS (DUF1127 family)
MTTANPCCPETFPADPINARQLMATGSTYLSTLWRAWRERRLERAKWRALEELSDATRRDLGLAERQMHAPGALSPSRSRLTWG